HSIEHRLTGIDADLVAPGTVTLEQLILSVRRWLGFPAPAVVIHVPGFVGNATAHLGDLAGWLGWRPALRTTSIRVLKTGVTGDAAVWTALTGQHLRPLAQSLQDLPSTVQERTYARAALLFPMLLLLLSGFWIASGVIGWLEREAAAEVLAGIVPSGMAQTLVAGGSFADILIGAGLLLRPVTRPAALAALGLSLAYLVSGTILTPHLWSDPLGPLVKIFPAMGLALAVWFLSEPR
ncbi:MAG: DoxX-like family protein, partial [Hyphomonas sp.]